MDSHIEPSGDPLGTKTTGATPAPSAALRTAVTTTITSTSTATTTSTTQTKVNRLDEKLGAKQAKVEQDNYRSSQVEPKLAGVHTIISSVERPAKNQPQIVSSQIPSSLGVKQNSNTTEDQELPTTNPVIISQLQQLQSPLPQPNSRDASLAQAKSRHRGFLRQLLCCFRPSTSNIYLGPNCLYNNTDLPQRDATQAQRQTPLPIKYSGKFLLPARKPGDNRICLVIDLDETLVHSSFKPIQDADFIVPVEIDGTLHKVYVLKRPHVDEFLKKMGQLYECVLFTASLAKYADPVADLLDKDNIFKARLFRESCAFYRGNYVKDLSRLGRDLNRVIIVDNSPASYIFHPDNAVSRTFNKLIGLAIDYTLSNSINNQIPLSTSFPNQQLPVTSYFDDETDHELLNLIPLLERVATNTGPVVPVNVYICYSDLFNQ